MTITEHVETSQQGYRYVIQSATCANCFGRIERAKPARAGVEIKWGHVTTGRSVCLLPTDVSKSATPL